MSSMPSTCPYKCGSDIILRTSDAQTAKAKIVDIKSMTMACVMVVQFYSSPGLSVLKLYDRRFAMQLRRDEEAATWDVDIESCYQAHIRTGHQSTLFSRWSAGYRGDPYWEDEQRKEWDQGTLEMHLQFLCYAAYTTETRAYELMHDIQGIHVPKFYDKVALYPSESPITHSDILDKHLDCPGILMQHIPGYPLTDLARYVDPQNWQRICEEAIDIIHKIGDRGICNRDVKTRSFILSEVPGKSFPDIYMVDFGLCLFREQTENEYEFRELQADQDEEGAIGCVMERLLKGGYSYRRSQRALRLLKDFKSEE